MNIDKMLNSDNLRLLKGVAGMSRRSPGCKGTGPSAGGGDCRSRLLDAPDGLVARRPTMFARTILIACAATAAATVGVSAPVLGAEGASGTTIAVIPAAAASGTTGRRILKV